MSSLTLLQARTLVRELAQDTSSSNPANSDSQLNDYIELERQWYATTYPDEMVAVASAAVSFTGTGSGQATVTTTNTFRSLDFAIWNATGDYLARDEYYHLLQLQAGVSLGGVPSTWAAIRNAGADNSWSAAIYPIPDLTGTVAFYGHYEVVPLTGDSDVLLFGQNGSRTICVLASLTAARNAGRSQQFLGALANMLPDRIASRRADIDRLLKPKPMVT